ncbi:phosphoglycan beta 1,3 galactosyltransferase 2 [Leishmania braziliensis MHOM/BR/75/M2904]|uniref:Phosphoglycan beta 1,3 galactosyltransferase 2 n=1 Tax=Leishmania braziliensis TaxID=5660 RepID=E9AIP8_LEIBR|nr:phosphoglycan beta 1,3 galactosyltransferase 2 [Leishmania braziliensis MHOM/BR/75/M2904]CBZ14693.1 phosphoglycan beta 1,3 galactosyltransferase 2 [Leishmania braziliensis MHOM/BR/75/M2904]
MHRHASLVSQNSSVLNCPANSRSCNRTRSRAEPDQTRLLGGRERDAASLEKDDGLPDEAALSLPFRFCRHLRGFVVQAVHSRTRRRRLVALIILPVLMVTLYYIGSCATASHPRQNHSSIELQRKLATVSDRDTFSVLVQHESALQRLASAQHALDAAAADGKVRLRSDQLPSWTLRVIGKNCMMCFDRVTYGAAVAGGYGEMAGGRPDQEAKGLPVFATTSAPLGLMGPMLFAMASVTDDVDVAAELPLWPWVSRSYAQQCHLANASLRKSKSTQPQHLVVMGIPSTDQPMRYPLRDAQRATWLTYREVARAENNFTGALLQLYVFAAAERRSDDSPRDTVDTAQLAPTVNEYAAASLQRLALEGGDAANAPSHVQRRVVLRDGWRDVSKADGAVWGSPCIGVKASVVSPEGFVGEASSLTKLSSALSLPATPAFTSAARYMCHVSTALWQEALHHRNSLWLDLLTDRHPTTNKMGMSNSWGVPTEVGMSQKVVIWLNYAYTAFPDVPYLMKGDDDMYLKVPQYLSDLRYMQRGGWGRPRNLTATIPHDDVIPATLGIDDTKDCLYRVWRLYYGDIIYGNGVGYILDRRLVQAALNPFDSSNALLLKLLTEPYNSSLYNEYLSLIMQYEDVLVGKQVKDHLGGVRQLCPGRRVCYMADRGSRAHQILRPVASRLTWNSVMTHFGMPAIPYYVHYFHKNELKVTEEAKRLIERGLDVNAIEANATKNMEEWVASQVPKTLVGLGSVLDLSWVRGKPRTTYVVAEEDDVAVYDVRYKHAKAHIAKCIWVSG